MMKKSLTAIPGVVVAVIDAIGPGGQPMVRFGENSVPARTLTAPWIGAPPEWSAFVGSRVVVGFEDGDESKPILLGLLDPAPSDREESASGAHEEPVRCRGTKPKTLRIESESELILECGKAKISLRADGRVVILGGYVLSRSRGVNKIKGGSVHIN